MALRKRKQPIRNERDAETKPQKKKKTIIYSITQIFRNLSISVNLTVYAIYLIYLIYSVSAEVGPKPVNLALALATGAFMIVYLVLRLSGRRSRRQLRVIKHYYKNFKLVARTFGAIIAVYALTTALTSVSPLAIIIAFLGAVFMILRLIVELILSLIKRKIRKIKGDKSENVEDAYDESLETEDDEDEPVRKPKKKRKLSLKRNNENADPIIIPVDACLLNDIEE